MRIGAGYGLAFLPFYVCQDLKLIEKHGGEAQLGLAASFHSFSGAGAMQDALTAGTIDMAPFGLAPLLLAWEKSRGTPQQIVAVSGISTLPMVLLANRDNLKTIADFKPDDRIAMPTATAPQSYFLQMQAVKTFGQFDRLRRQVLVLPHAQAVTALLSGGGKVSAYFSSAPYTELALADGRVHKILSSSDVIDGKASFLVLGATRDYVESHARTAAAVAAAMAEAAQIIAADPHRAAQIFLAHEPSKSLDTAALDQVVGDIKGEFGSGVFGVQAIADFMGWRGILKDPPRSWKEIVAPALRDIPGT